MNFNQIVKDKIRKELDLHFDQEKFVEEALECIDIESMLIAKLDKYAESIEFYGLVKEAIEEIMEEMIEEEINNYIECPF